jgi:hypothetical protein
MPDESQIPGPMLQRIRIGLSLPDEKLKALNEWAKKNYGSLITSEFTDTSVYDQLNIPAEPFYGACSAITTYLFDNDVPSLDAYVEQLKKQGLGELTEKARILLGGINPTSAEIELVRLRTIATQAVVPTLSDVDCVCELRAVFRSMPGPFQAEQYREKARVLLGFEPVVLVNITTNDANGDESVCFFQATENGLRALMQTLEEAAGQLEVVKQRFAGTKETK